MQLESALAHATSALDSISKQLGTVAQNVANASSPGYSRETLAAVSVSLEGSGAGVRSGVATRSVDAVLQQNLLTSDGRVSEDLVRQSLLASIDAASGAPGNGQDLASLLGALRDGFSSLASDPSNQTQQRRVVSLASAVAEGLNTLGGAVRDARQLAQDGLVQDVAAANAALGTVGQVSNQIMSAQARHESTADLEDKRDLAMTTVTQLTGARFLPQSNGDTLAVSGGILLPLRAASGPLAIASATVGGSLATLPAVTINGIAAPIAGGRIGAELTMRDTVLPGLQTDLDNFAQSLATGFSAKGLTLFTDGAGTIPATGAAGFAQTIQVSSAVRATPSMVRDGSASPRAAGDTSLIDSVLGSVLTTGPGTIAGMATDLVANHASLASEAAERLATEEVVQSGLTAKFQAGTAVSVDGELAQMLQLQNSYGANAKVIATSQTMWTQLLGMVQ